MASTETAGTEVLDDGFLERARDCADFVRDSEDLLLISHIDADGLTSAGVASLALDRAGVEHETRFSKQLDADDLDEIGDAGHDTVLFTDFGSGILDEVTERDFTPVVADHHQPAEGADCEYHLNPLLFDIDGSSELSGAGTAYVLARALEEEVGANKDLAALAVVGAVGDMQNQGGGLSGANTAIVSEGVAAGVLEAKQDLLLFGRQTRPLPKLLEYSTDVFIPGISKNSTGAKELLEDAGVDAKNDEGGGWRTWADLDETERERLTNALFRKCVERGVDSSAIEELVGETYTLLNEKPHTELRDASEFSTLLNSTARYERADVGFAVCKGDRGDALDEARELLRGHRRNLRNGVEFVGRNGVTKLENVQYFDAGDEIQDTIVGIIAGMSYSKSAVDRGMPIIAFADSDDEGEKKVSSRATKRLVRKGLNLAEVMGECSRAVGGDGGGHDIAAGATIPDDAVEEFMQEVDAKVEEQIS
ncbi:MAG: DHH family phosphoesterase [Halobacteriales archaeon]|nr:DHH family phosphoesterase [Halobacteriales archaeon]